MQASSGRRIPVIGLVGGVGSGKSTLARRLAERRKILTLDADEFGHQALTLERVKQQIRARFGDAVFDEHGDILRRELARRVFGEQPEKRQAREELEALVHPEIGRMIRERVDETQRQGGVAAILLDAAVLLEAGWREFCDAVVFIDTPDEERLNRVNATRGWTAEELRRREASQWPLDEKRRRVDYTVSNQGAVDAAVNELDAVVSRVVHPFP